MEYFAVALGLSIALNIILFLKLRARTRHLYNLRDWADHYQEKGSNLR